MRTAGHSSIDDPRALFREHAAELRRRRRGRSFRRGGAWSGAVLAIGLIALSPTLFERFVPSGAFGPRTDVAENGEEGGDTSGFEVASADTRRDPLLLLAPSDKAVTGTVREVRFENSRRTPLTYVSDTMGRGAADLSIALPASPADFALMGSAEIAALDSREAAGTVSEDGFGTGVIEVRSSGSGAAIAQDRVTRLLDKRTVAAVLGTADADGSAADAALRLLEAKELGPGAVLASRTDLVVGRRQVVQLSLYQPGGGAFSIGRGEMGGFARIEDPWAGEGLAAYTAADAGAGTRVRIMDGLYAAGVRNGVPPNVVSEAIVQMARAHDLSRPIGPNDRFDLLYSGKPRDGTRGTGHVLYASVSSGSRTLRCYVLKPDRKDDYTCMTEEDTVSVPEGGPAGFVTPVKGVLRSRFGMRNHPILKRRRMHSGVDWAAPSGTPIVAAFAGTVTYKGVRGGYGNYVKLRHAGGLETAYAHMSRYASGLRKGSSVEAGEVIGYVGTTGMSTGPHLHFELHANGRPVDPLTARAPAAPAAPPPPVYEDAPSGRGEIDKLIARIIHVESGGRATAKNPLSSATGLGQFIDSTWLRMMRTYRPDLTRRMNRRQLLSLRTEPGIAREMVYRLAAENRASLRRAGLPATAGNLYLCHFLGPGGAIAVLRANPRTPLVNIVGRGVINANPFLRGNDAEWVVRWAARKMNGRVPKRSQAYAAYQAPAPVLPAPVRVKNKRFKAYSEAIDDVLSRVRDPRPAPAEADGSGTAPTGSDERA